MGYTPISSANAVPFTPKHLEEQGLDAPVIMLGVPTPLFQEKLHSHLSALGLRRTTEQDIRAVLIDDLYNHFPEEEADKKADMLDRVWRLEEVENALAADWGRQERERLNDEAAGVSQPQMKFPDPILKARDKAQAKILVNEITSLSPRVRQAIAAQIDHGRKSNWLMVQMHVLPGGRNLGFELRRDTTGLLLEEDVEKLLGLFGQKGFEELTRKIDASHTLDEEEVGNSASPPEKPLLPNGSIEASGDGDSSGGASTKQEKDTTSSTGHVQAGESQSSTGESLPSVGETAAQA